jgi:uncharacterized protein YbaP (TraB family)
MGFINKASSTSFTYDQILLFDAYQQDFIRAIEHYNQNNLQQAVDLLTQDKYMDAASKEYILNKRNQNWVAKIPGMMAESSNLFAVGMAHLANENGLIQLLREAGCTVSPVLD